MLTDSVLAIVIMEVLPEKICKRKCVSRDEHHNVRCVTALCDETMMNYITVNSYGNVVVSDCPQWWHVIRRDKNIAFKLEKNYLAYDQKESCVTAQRTEYLFEECTLEHCSDDLAGKKHYVPDSGYSSPFDTPCCSERDNDIPHLFNIFNKFDESEDKSSKESQAESYSNKLREISKKLAEEHIPAPTQNSLKSTVSDHSGKHVPCDEIRSWKKCIKEQDETGICSLIERRILPDKDDLDLACFKFGRRSQTFTNILTFICEYIKSQSSDVLNVWASYDAQQCENSGIIHTIFVIITKTDAAYVGELRYTRQRQKTEISMESKVVMESRLSDIKQKKKSDIKESSLEELSNCVTKNAEYLMEKHSNISAICPSTKKSTGFGTQDHKIIDVPCITIYVHVKGLTPIREDPFPKQICGFPTDVIEESLLLFHGGPNVYHNNLKMGMAIHANIRTPEDDILSGTLGCFLDHKEYGLCCITSSHFLLNEDEKYHIRSKDGLYDLRYLNRCVHQPCGEMNYMTSFGNIISVAYRLGDIESPGVEAGLIQILQRHPLKGDFPDADNYDDAGFDESKPLLFESGQVLTVGHKHMNLIVYKFGMSTGCTRGCIGVRGASIRKTEVKEDTCIYHLRNQLEILPVGGLPFATAGDSGALVMIEGEANDSIAIGIVTGGFLNGTVFVTPICAILDAFGCPHSLKVFKDKAETVSLMSHDSGISGSEAMEFTSSEV